MHAAPEPSADAHAQTRYAHLPTREVLRVLRSPEASPEGLPESTLWQAYIELHRRGDPSAGPAFVRALRTLHQRRGLARAGLGASDPSPEEHRLAADPYLQDLWKSYKRCLCAHRHVPAGQLLRELERHVA